MVGVRWREANPLNYAKAGDLSLPLKSYVVLQLEKSQELAWVCREAAERVDCQIDRGDRTLRKQPLLRPVDGQIRVHLGADGQGASSAH